MIEYIQELSPNEAAGIKKTIQDLFRQTCILQVKCDPVTLVQRDNPRYRICANHREFIADYLSVLDCELVHDPHEHIFRIKGEGMPTDRMTLTGTRILLILKVIYRDKIMGEGLNATVTSLEEIREVGRSTNLLARRLTVQEWQDTLTMLKTHQIIELPGAVGSLEDDTPIYIYSTINIFCSSVELGELIKNYTDVAEDMEDPTKDSMEDSSEDSMENLTKDSMEDLTKDSMENPSEDLMEDPTKDSMEDPTKDSMEDPPEDSMENPTIDSTEDSSEDLIENSTKDSMEDSPEDSMENPIQEHQDAGDTEEFTSEEIKENIYEDVPQ